MKNGWTLVPSLLCFCSACKASTCERTRAVTIAEAPVFTLLSHKKHDKKVIITSSECWVKMFPISTTGENQLQICFAAHNYNSYLRARVIKNHFEWQEGKRVLQQITPSPWSSGLNIFESMNNSNWRRGKTKDVLNTQRTVKQHTLWTSWKTVQVCVEVVTGEAKICNSKPTF